MNLWYVYVVVVFCFLSCAAFEGVATPSMSRHAFGHLGPAARQQAIHSGWVRSEVYLDRDQVTRLIEQARDRTVPSHARVDALERLASYRQQRVRRAMVSLLGDPVSAVRVAAIEGLGVIADTTTIPILIDALRWCRGRPRRAIRDSLERMTGQDLGDDHRTWYRWLQANRHDFR